MAGSPNYHTYDELLSAMERSGKSYDLKMLGEAYKVALKAHEGQKRVSGVDYILHPISVAYILVELGMDSSVVAAALLHDVVENTKQPNHAVAISSVSSSTDEITLFNPYTEEELTTYSLSLFLNAWAQSNNYLVVVNTTDKFVYEPYPIHLDDITLDENLSELQEAIAENAHEIWAKARTDQGWTYGPERNDQKKETPDMVPYCNLPESEKLYDREMAMQTLKLVKKLGFEIKKK